MKILAVIISAALGCSTVKPIADPVLSKVEGAIDCTAPLIVSQRVAIAEEVARDLASVDWAALLADLANRVKDDVVICAVQASVAKASAPAATSSSTADDPIVKNGRAYLFARDVHFVRQQAAMGSIGGCVPACVAPKVCKFYQPPPGAGLHGVWACGS